VTICPTDLLTPDRGVSARVGDDVVAVFLLADGSTFAVDDRDPFTGAHVLSRGIVGDAGGAPTVASPLYKQRFDLRSGACLDDDAIAVRTWPTRIQGGHVEVGQA
jgi:nitrite reductase (NADH) small subunit